MAKKKTEDFEVDMMTTEVNDEEKKEVANALFKAKGIDNRNH